jgi:hypothetical protein
MAGLSTDTYRLLADLVVALHAVFVAFVVFGQALVLLGWWRGWGWTRNPWLRWSHLAAIAVVVAQAWLGAACPLTLLEMELRLAAGEGIYGTSFVGHWLDRLLFYLAPGWVFTLAYTAFGLLVLASFLGHPPRRGRAR